MTKRNDGCTFDNMNEIGPEVDGLSQVPYEVWAKMLNLKTKEPTGYVRRLRIRQRVEVFRDLNTAIGRLYICPCCKEEYQGKPAEYTPVCPVCKGEMEPLIDEYLSGPYGEDEHKLCGPVSRIVCFPVTGGSEGHYVHIGCLVDKGYDRDAVEYQEWFLVKTFRGMDHAAEIARRCAVLLGA